MIMTRLWRIRNLQVNHDRLGNSKATFPCPNCAVTPSPPHRRKQKAVQTLDTLGLDPENVARLPTRKRNRLTSKSVGETAAPRRTLPRRQATLQTQAEMARLCSTWTTTRRRRIRNLPQSKRHPSVEERHPTRLQVKLSSDEEEEESEQESSSDESDEALL